MDENTVVAEQHMVEMCVVGEEECGGGEWGRGRLKDVFTKLKGFRKCNHTAVLNHLKVIK